jgi:hypothetical protein
MRSFRWSVAACLAATLAIAANAQGQERNNPRAGYVYPAGGQQGSTVQVEVGGRFLDGVTSVLVSGSGIQATIVAQNKPLTAREASDLRERLQELRKNGSDAATRTDIAGLTERLRDSLRRNANPAVSETAMLAITIAPDAEPGARSLRLSTLLGVTNPLVFCVGQLPEFRESGAETAPSDVPITLPAVLNGRIIPVEPDRIRAPLRQGSQDMRGDLDRYRFQARKGQQLVIAVSARELMPYLADAVPGWFQATLGLFDANGREVAYSDDYRFHPDPVLHYEVPADGEYTIEIKDALYRGREDFVYRIAIGELPFVTSIFPLGGRAGAQTSVAVEGWNLTSNRQTKDARDRGPETCPLEVRAGQVGSNRMPFAIDTLPETFEREPNDSPTTAEPVTGPVIVNGRILQPGDWDVFKFTGRAGEGVVAEVQARRLESPLDSVLELTDGAGRRLAFDDDNEDKGSGLLTHHADSLLSATLPANGTYFLRLGDVQGKGGSAYAYRLRVSPPRPDFDLRIVPSSINAGGSGTVPLTVYALRRDGFSGDIALALENPPAGFSLSGGLIPAGQNQVRLTVTVPPTPTEKPLSLKLEGRATIGGQTIVRQAVAADDMMQAFASHHLVPADALMASVTARGATRVSSKILGQRTAEIPIGGTAQVRVSIPPAYRRFEKIDVELSEPPEGITIHDMSLDSSGAVFLIQADGTKVKAGLRGNLIVTISAERVPPRDQPAPPAASRRLPLGTLPAIPFEIVELR